MSDYQYGEHSKQLLKIQDLIGNLKRILRIKKLPAVLIKLIKHQTTLSVAQQMQFTILN